MVPQLFVAILVLLVSCTSVLRGGASLEVGTWYDAEVDFSTFESFFLAGVPEVRLQPADARLRKRARGEILADRGFVEKTKADAAVQAIFQDRIPQSQ
jgi:hypothetical protein